MEFGTKIIFLTAVILMNSMYLSYQQETQQKIEKKTPEERCTADNDTVCVDCFKFGTCLLDTDNKTFTIVNITDCEKTSALYCDDSVFASGPFGMCAPYRPSFTNCSCSGVDTCNEDPNDPRKILNCGSGSPVPADPCPAAALNLTTCECSTCSESCPLLDDPNDDCSKFFFCNGNELIPSNCSSSLCFDQESCRCIDREATTTTTTTSTTPTTNATTATPTTNATTTAPVTNTTTTTPTTPTTNATTTTPTTLSTNATTTTPTTPTTNATTTALTTPTTNATTTTPTTPTTSTTNTTPTTNATTTTPTTLSTNATTTTPTTPTTNATTTTPSTNGTTTSPAISATTTLPSTTTARITCKPGCPYAKDPADTCQKFFVCDRNALVPLSCPGRLCFNERRCLCT